MVQARPRARLPPHFAVEMLHERTLAAFEVMLALLPGRDEVPVRPDFQGHAPAVGAPRAPHEQMNEGYPTVGEVDVGLLALCFHLLGA